MPPVSSHLVFVAVTVLLCCATTTVVATPFDEAQRRIDESHAVASAVAVGVDSDLSPDRQRAWLGWFLAHTRVDSPRAATLAWAWVDALGHGDRTVLDALEQLAADDPLLVTLRTHRCNGSTPASDGLCHVQVYRVFDDLDLMDRPSAHRVPESPRGPTSYQPFDDETQWHPARDVSTPVARYRPFDDNDIVAAIEPPDPLRTNSVAVPNTKCDSDWVRFTWTPGQCRFGERFDSANTLVRPNRHHIEATPLFHPIDLELRDIGLRVAGQSWTLVADGPIDIVVPSDGPERLVVETMGPSGPFAASNIERADIVRVEGSEGDARAVGEQLMRSECHATQRCEAFRVEDASEDVWWVLVHRPVAGLEPRLPVFAWAYRLSARSR